MRIQWYGQSAFLLAGEQTVFIDPFDRPGEALAARGLEFNYAPIEDVTADLLLDHARARRPQRGRGDRRRAGRRSARPRGGSNHRSVRCVAIASEHDDVAGTVRGPNTIFRFALDGIHVRPSRRLRAAARFAPSSTPRSARSMCCSCRSARGRRSAASRPSQLVRSLAPRLVVPMHYRTAAVNFLEPPDAFLAALGADVTRLETSDGELDALLGTSAAPRVVLFAPPLA